MNLFARSSGWNDLDAVNVARVLEFSGGLNHSELYKLHRYLSVSVAQREAKKSRAFVETTNLPRDKHIWILAHYSTRYVRAGLLLLAERCNTHNRSKKAQQEQRTASEITVINIVGLAPSQFIAKSCFL